MYYQINSTFIHRGTRHRKDGRGWFDADAAKDLIRKNLIVPCEIKKKIIDKPSALPVAQASQPTIAQEPKHGKKQRPKLGLSSQQTQATE